MAESEVMAQHASPSAGHTAAAWFKLAWLGVVILGASFIAFRRSFGCSPDDGLWGYVCSFRMAGVGLLAVDLASLWTLLWFAAQYDDDAPARAAAPSVLRPGKMLTAAARASSRRSTPHRWKHRIGFWAFAAMFCGFVYLVYFANVASA